MRQSILMAAFICVFTISSAQARDTARGYEIAGFAIGSKFSADLPALAEFRHNAKKGSDYFIGNNAQGDKISGHIKDGIIFWVSLTKYYDSHRKLVAAFKKELEERQRTLGMMTKAVIFDSNPAQIRVDRNGRHAWSNGPGYSCGTWYFKGSRASDGITINSYETSNGVDSWCVTPDAGQDAIGIYTYQENTRYGLVISASVQVLK